MRALTLALALTAAAFGAPAVGGVYTFNASLNGANEATPNASAGAAVSKLFLNTDLHQLRIMVDFTDLSGATFAAHVHAPTASPNTGEAGVATELPSFTGFPSGVMAGTYDHTFDTTLDGTWNPGFVAANGGTALSAEAAFLGALVDEKAYINIHTTFAPTGEIRGFYAQVPEPSAWALMIAGLGLAGAALRRRTAAARATLILPFQKPLTSLK